MAAQAADTRTKGQRQHDEVNDLVLSGSSVTEAAKTVAERTGDSVGSIQNAYFRIKRKAGGASPRAASASSTPSTVSVPKDLAPLLDAIKKDRASLSANIDKVIAWASAQEEKTKSAVADAREVAIRQMREAAAGLK